MCKHFVVLATAALLSSGCATRGETGALAGGALGAAPGPSSAIRLGTPAREHYWEGRGRDQRRTDG